MMLHNRNGNGEKLRQSWLRKGLKIKQGQSYHVGDGDPPHRSATLTGREAIYRGPKLD